MSNKRVNRAKELENEVERLNKKLDLKKNDAHLVVGKAYGGYTVEMTGGELGTGRTHVTYGYGPAKETLCLLYKKDSQGEIEYLAKKYKKK